MKKILAIVLVMLLSVTSFSPMTASTASIPTFAVSTHNGLRGDTFTASVSIENNPGIVSFKVDIGYDTNVLTLVSVTGGVFSRTSFGPVTNNPIAVSWVDALNPNNFTNGVVATLTFKIKDDAPFGKSAITVTYTPDDVYDFDFENVAFATINGSVNVTCLHENTTDVSAKGSTCTSQGNDAYTVCNDCGAVTVGSNIKLPFSPHTYDDKYDTDCNVCGTIRGAATTTATTTSTKKPIGQSTTVSSTKSTTKTIGQSVAVSTAKPTTKPIGQPTTVSTVTPSAEPTTKPIVAPTTKPVTAVVKGDVNEDGKVTITDMLAVKSHLLKKSTLSGKAAKAADTNGDGKITITDFLQVKSQLLDKSKL